MACPEIGIYAACLASYNNGLLYGHWIDLATADGVEGASEAIQWILSASPTPGAEEYAIHAHSGLPSFLVSSEWPDLSQLMAYTANVQEVAESHGDAAAYRAWCENLGEVASVEDFEDHDQGLWDSPEDFAQDLFDQTGQLSDLPDCLAHRIDWAGVWRDLDCDGWSATFNPTEGGYQIFSP